MLHVERDDTGHRPAEPVVRRGRGRLVFQRQPTGHRWRLVANGWRHVRQHNTVDGHSPPAPSADRRSVVRAAAAASRRRAAGNRLLQTVTQTTL